MTPWCSSSCFSAAPPTGVRVHCGGVCEELEGGGLTGWGLLSISILTCLCDLEAMRFPIHQGAMMSDGFLHWALAKGRGKQHGRNQRDCHPLIAVVIASHNGESLPSGSWDQSAKGDGSALESRSLGLAFPVGNLKLGLRELNSG